MNRLKEFREEALMTVRELSERSGVSEDTITKIENGHRKGRSMTVRKLAKALRVRPHQLSPELFEQMNEAEQSAPDVLAQDSPIGSEMADVSPPQNAVEDAQVVELAIARAYEVAHALQQRAENAPPLRGYPDGVPRADITERQHRVLVTVLECGVVGPSTVADRLKISVSTAYRDLSVLEEHDLVMTDESGARMISPLGRDLVGAILDIRKRLYYDEALKHISTLVKAYESAAAYDSRRPTVEEASLFLVQEITIRSIRRIVAAIKSAPADQTLTQKLRENLWINSIEVAPPVDQWHLASRVWNVLNGYMANPPSQRTIRADIEGVPPIEVLEALDMTIAAYLADRPEVEAKEHHHAYRRFLGLLKGPHRSRYLRQQDEDYSRQQAETGEVNR